MQFLLLFYLVFFLLRLMACRLQYRYRRRRFNLLFRFRWQIRSHASYPSTLRVPGGHFGCQVFRTCRWTLSSQGSQPRRDGVHQLWGDVDHSEREAVVSAQSQDQGSVWQVSGRTGQDWRTTCPQSYHRPSTSVLCLCRFLCCSVLVMFTLLCCC